jgi:hypothetical protein
MTLFPNHWCRSTLQLFVVFCAFFFCFSIVHAQSETNSEFKNEPSLTKENQIINADGINISVR